MTHQLQLKYWALFNLFADHFLTDDVQNIRSDERLSASEANFVHAFSDKEASQGQHLRGGKQLASWRELHSLLWHAVLTWERETSNM